MAAVRRSLLNPHAPEYVPISNLSPPPLPPPSVLLPPPPSPLPPPPPTVDSLLRENGRAPSVTLPCRNIPPRLRNDYVARRGGGGGGGGRRGFSRSSNGNRGGFGRGRCSNEGLVWRRSVENDQRQGVYYDKWSRNNGLKKHDVIPISWTHNNNTTVMIKNIPYHYNREMLMQFLDQHCFLENQTARDSNGENIHIFAYDFLYLPMDFKRKRSKGYAFVNFTDQRTVWKFFGVFNDKLNVFPGSTRSVKIVTAKIQGKAALVNRFKQTRFECESEGFLPVWFSPPRDGSGESVQMITVGQYKVTPSCSYIFKKP